MDDRRQDREDLGRSTRLEPPIDGILVYLGIIGSLHSKYSNPRPFDNEQD